MSKATDATSSTRRRPARCRSGWTTARWPRACSSSPTRKTERKRVHGPLTKGNRLTDAEKNVMAQKLARFTSIDADAAGEREEFDISNSALHGPYTAMFQDYVRNELKWETDRVSYSYYEAG